MKKTLLATALLSLALCASCSGGKSDAAAGQSADSAQAQGGAEKPQAIDEHTTSYDATLAGHAYHVTILRKADPSLPVVEDELGATYDNRVEVSITRDGEAFFSHAYTKQSFAEFLTPEEQSTCILDGMALNNESSDAHAIRLGAQVSQPGIGEGPAFIIEIPLDGSASGIVRDKMQDDMGSEGMTD